MSELRHPVLLVQYETTRDHRIDEPDGGWTCLSVPPPGGGWVVADNTHDTKTRWRRVLLVDLATLISQDQRG